MLRKGEKPIAYLDIPINFDDFEVIDLFNWQKEAQNMLSQQDFTRMVDVQYETILDYLRDKKIVPDMAVPIGDTRVLNFFKEETIHKYAKEFKWKLITAENMKDLFMEYIRKMSMMYSYKPVLVQAFFENIDEEGKAKVDGIVESVMDFYQWRREKGLIVEKPKNFYLNPDLTEKEVEKHIFAQPFNRFSGMRFMMRSRDVSYIELNQHIFKKVTDEDIVEILQVCEKKLDEYYGKIGEETH